LTNFFEALFISDVQLYISFIFITGVNPPHYKRIKSRRPLIYWI